MAMYKTALIKTLLLVGTSCLLGCQNTRKKSCQSLNWRSLGTTAASQGKIKNPTFQELKLRCKKFKIPADQVSFNEGYLRGLVQFCTPEKAYDFGKSGQKYKETCLKNQNIFLSGYYEGRLNHLKQKLLKKEALYTEAADRLWRKEREYLITQNEDPQKAKFQADIIDAYREETRILAQEKRILKKEIQQTKKLLSEQALL